MVVCPLFYTHTNQRKVQVIEIISYWTFHSYWHSRSPDTCTYLQAAEILLLRSCIHSRNRQIFPDSVAVKKSKYETSYGSRPQEVNYRKMWNRYSFCT